jgi:phosphatidylglycerophosphate synthase
MTLRQIPMAMIVSRFLAVPVLLWAALSRQSSWWLVGILVYVFLSDVFDGIIARRLRIVTERLRVADSWADTGFYFGAAFAIWWLHRALLVPFTVPLLIVLALLAINWIAAMVKFHRTLSFHAYSSKLWGLSLFAASVAILGFSTTGVWLWLAILVGILGNLEGFAMILILPHWAHDISGIPEALRLRTKMKIKP